MTSLAESAETRAEEERRTGYLELFFDLVFVFAITEVTTLLLSDTSATGFARSVLVLGLIWWAWSGYAWMTNAIEIDDLAIRVVFLLATAASFFMALGVPGAFSGEGAWFAVPYFAVRVVQVGLYLYGLRARADERRAFAALAPWFLIAPTIALVGGFLDTRWLTVLWAVSLLIDVAGTLTLGRENDFRVSASHFAERYGLFVIIALGESIVAIGLAASEIPRNATLAAGVVIALVGAVGLWWAYFDFVALALERVLRRTPERRRGTVARDLFTLFHFPLVVGIIFYAVSAKLVLEDPHEPLPASGRWALGLGVACYFAAVGLIRFRAVRRIAWERLAGGVAALVAVVVLQDLQAMTLLGVVVGILVLATAAEARRLRHVRAELRGA